MQPFDFIGGVLCLDFINTTHCFGRGNPGEELCAAEDLFRWALEAGVLTANDAARLRKQCSRHPDKANTILKQAKTLGAGLRSLFKTVLLKRELTPREIGLLNGWLKQCPAEARIERHSGGWRMRWHSEAEDARKIFYQVLTSAAELISGGQLRFVRECASPTCTWMFLDMSKNHTRRWCDMRECGNREKIHRFRERMRKAKLGSHKLTDNARSAQRWTR